MLELLRIPYTGSDVLGSALAMDKLKSKELFRLHNVPTPPYYEFAAHHTLDDLGIAKTAREEKLRARDEKLKKSADDARMEKLYRQHILKEAQPEGGFVPLGSITPANGNGKAKVEEKEEVFGD